MTKTQFLQQLYNNLLPLTSEERNEIIQDFEEHFSAGVESGKTEEQICAELGSPASCAASYLQGVNQDENTPTENNTNNTHTAGSVNYTYEQPVSTPNPNINSKRNNFLWMLMFFFFLLCSIGIYPTAIGFMLMPILIAISSIFMVAAVPSGLMICFLVSLSVSFFTAGLIMFLVMTRLLKLSFKKSGF